VTESVKQLITKKVTRLIVVKYNFYWFLLFFIHCIIF